MTGNKRYSNGEITILWQPALCQHGGACFRGLPEVFDPRRRPWIQPDAASSDEIVAQVAKCVSGALTIVDSAADPGVADPSP